MGTKISAVDDYIAKAQPFARPILKHLRKLVHQGCPAVVEQIKWGVPHFDYRGMFCGMAAFKQHAAFGFWKQELAFKGDVSKAGEAMGQLGRITALKDLPSDAALLAHIRRAVTLRDTAEHQPAPKRAARPAAKVPADLAAALKTNTAARQHFEAFSPSKRRDYIEWLTEAKRAETRAQRLVTALEWIAQGKARHWKYEKC